MTTYSQAPFHIVPTATQPQAQPQQPARRPRLIDGPALALAAGIGASLLLATVSGLAITALF